MYNSDTRCGKNKYPVTKLKNFPIEKFRIQYIYVNRFRHDDILLDISLLAVFKEAIIYLLDCLLWKNRFVN
jgi:hypothetical protein